MNSLYSCILSLVISFYRYKEYMASLISFSKLSDALPAFTYAIVICKISSICLEVNIFNPLPFCCSINSKIFSTILTTFLGFSFSEISLLLIEFTQLIIDSF